MRMSQTLVISEFGPFAIEAVYDYRVELPYHNKHAPTPVEAIKIDKIELHIRQAVNRRTRHGRAQFWKTIKTIQPINIPGWLWELLNDHETLATLDTDMTLASADEESDDDPEI